MYATTRNFVRSKTLLKLDSYKVEKVALIHVCASRHWNVVAKKLPSCYQSTNNVTRFSHIRHLSANTTVTNQQDTITVFSPGKQASSTTPLLEKANVTTSSTATTSASDAADQVANITVPTLPPIPEPPKPPLPATWQGEPPFESLGLGGWSPVGILQNCFEFLHINMELPWWQCIVLGTVVIRVCMTPLVVISQRMAGNMANNGPGMQKLQLKINQAKARGEIMEAAQHSQELMMFMKEKNLNPLKNMLVPLVQAPIFISFFMGLREMANLPVKSLHNGGLFWFTDLTVPDQYYILPFLTCATLLATIELGSDGKITGQNTQLVKLVFRALPVVLFPFIMNFPGVLHLYWFSTNTFSLVQVALLRHTRLRKLCKIPEMQKIDKSKLPVESKPMIPAVKEWWKDTRNTSKIESRGQVDRTAFLEAGRSAIKKTYKYNPVSQRPQAGPVHAKKI